MLPSCQAFKHVIFWLTQCPCRLRRVVYAESRKLRLRVNGFKDYIEPAHLNEIPVPAPVPQITLPYQNAVKQVEVSAA